MRYFKRHWAEDRGDEYADWGTATYYFEVAPDGSPERQMEVYANGQVLQYDQQHVQDGFGKLADQPLPMDEFAPFEIGGQEFEHAWTYWKPDNR